MKVLDLFCGAGGAAMGLHQAWPDADITGVDLRPMPRYPFRFVQADAMTFPLEGYDFIWASPPCQAYSRATAGRGDRSTHPDLIEAVRDRLIAAATPFTIENVQDARHKLRTPRMLCGSMFGLPFQSHRFFEVRPSIPQLWEPCRHRPGDVSRDHGTKQRESAFRDALGCHWMGVTEARQAIPPAYSRYIAEQLTPALSLDAENGQPED